MSDSDEHFSYLIKVRATSKFIAIRDNFIESLKKLEFIKSIEPLRDGKCFYIDTDNVDRFELFLQNLKSALRKDKYGDLIHSKIQNVYKTKQKEADYEKSKKKKTN